MSKLSVCILVGLGLLSGELFAETEFAMTQSSCTHILRARQELYAHARNLIHRTGKTSTKKPSGPLVVVCEKNMVKCDLMSIVHPGVPVILDRIKSDELLSISKGTDTVFDVNESMSFHFLAAELRGLATSNFCGATIKDIGTAYIITYPNQLGGGSEIFNVDHGRVLSWVHDSNVFQYLIVNFDSEGHAIGYQ